jgi:formylmethanofuran dehydrogenase subunit E
MKKSKPTTTGEKKCQHHWSEDEMFACGAITMIGGDMQNISEETRIVCDKCGESDYIPKRRLGSFIDLVKDTL